MPELAEVETVRRQLQARMRGLKITEIVIDTDDIYLFAFVKIKEVRSALLGSRVVGTGRKGKYFRLELDRKPAWVPDLQI